MQILEKISWQKYLKFIFLLLATGLFSSGLISWVAANWELISNAQKLYGAQILLILCGFCSSYFYFIEGRKQTEHKFKWLNANFVFLTSVVIGALFALLGQIYQTGAETWQLLAIWSIFQLPLLLLMPNIANGILFIASTNLALFFFFYATSFYGSNFTLYFIGINFLFFLLTTYFNHFFHDQRFRILSTISLLFFSLFCIVSMLDVGVITAIFVILLQTGIFYFYHKANSYLTNWIISYFSGVTSLIVLIMSRASLIESLSIFICFILVCASIIFAGLYLKDKVSQHKNLLINIMLLQFTLMAVATFSMFLYSIQIADELVVMRICSVLLISAGILFNNKFKLNQNFMSDSLYAIGILLWFIDYQPEYYLLASFLLVLFYVLKQGDWFRFLLACAFLGLNLYQFEADYSPFLMLLYFSFFSLLIVYLNSRQIKYTTHLMPLAWAGLLISLAVELVGKDIYYNNSHSAGIVSFSAYLQDNIGLLLSRFQELNPYNVIYVFFIILVIFIFTHVQKQNKVKYMPVQLVGFLLVLFLFHSNLYMLLCLSLLWIVWLRKSINLFTLSLLSLICLLAVYYYNLQVSLLNKSYLLILSSIIFSLMAYLNHSKGNNKERQVKQPVKLLKPILFSSVIVAILLVVNIKINSFEDVLENGESIILKLAPVDPRSLMQGDYMDLNYEIISPARTEIESLLKEEQNGDYFSQQFYLLLTKNKQNENKSEDELCAIADHIPQEQDFDTCRQGVYLPARYIDGQLSLPSHAYFFAEGKGEYYAQAMYGEYKFKNGVALLSKLLDKNFNPL